MVYLRKLKNTGEVSLGVSKMGTVRFFLSSGKEDKSTQGFTAFDVLEEVVKKANKSGTIYWGACPRNVAVSNKVGINHSLLEIDSSPDLKKLFDDVESTLKNNFINSDITVTKLKKLSGFKIRKFLDLTNLATCQQLDFFICHGLVVKKKQANEDADEKKSCNIYRIEETGDCPFLKFNDKLNCFQCTCKDFKNIHKGNLR